jgi:hypothetical protein
MKKINKLLLIASIFCSTALPVETSATKKNPILITDFDDVWIKKSSYLGLLAHLKPLENLFKSKKSSKDISDQPSEKKVRKLGNLSLRLLDYGRRYPTFASYVPELIEYIGKARYINQPIHNFYKHLKEENYSIVMATNKDHILYDLSIETLGNEIPNMVDKVFVAEPQSDETAIAQLQAFANQPTTPVNYKDMAYRVINIKETNKIVHVPSKKPAKEYFEYVVNNLGTDNDMIFIDDNKENVDAFNALQKDTSKLRLGIVYDENNLNQFAEDIKKAGMVSEEKDNALLDEIRYPGISGKIKQTLHYIFAG